MHQWTTRHAFLQAGQHQVRGVHHHGDADLMEDGLVLGVFDERHGAGHLEDVLGHLRDYQVGGVRARQAHHHIGAGDAGASQGHFVGAVSKQRHAT